MALTSGLDVESEECGSARIQRRKKFAHYASAFYGFDSELSAPRTFDLSTSVEPLLARNNRIKLVFSKSTLAEEDTELRDAIADSQNCSPECCCARGHFVLNRSRHPQRVFPMSQQ
jgi:hypothetical protein